MVRWYNIFSICYVKNVVCASTIMIWDLFELYSSNAVVAMMIERCNVVLFPIHSIHFVTRRFSAMLLCICMFCPVAWHLFQSAHFFSVFKQGVRRAQTAYFVFFLFQIFQGSRSLIGIYPSFVRCMSLLLLSLLLFYVWQLFTIKDVNVN